ncbi:unnamed protein product [Rhizophagus irregularis]|uniref:Crinkler effector protein N-terminal domain-containing protein n=1 Tax=Rhizophagus irregularis TaxID=588596 RepID=A0A2I1G158_9GLOM|nr:hypothetical protein RhiirA4_538784 [Rhizophagus irregularis]CAB4410222.1 unnamed protein product [Rhizophagus irregularis]
MSSFNITLCCLIHGNNISAAFPVKVDNDKTIGELKKIIKDENSNEFFGVDAKNLTLWKVEIPVNDDDKEEIKQLILQDNQKTKLLGIRYIEDYWTDSPPKRCIHVIVEPPTVAIPNQSTSIAKITHDMENFSLDNHMNASVPVSLSHNFFPEFLKILKENSEIMKQITLSLEQEKNRKREFEKDTSESMIVEAKAEGHNDVLFTFDPQKYFLGECKSSKSYLGELSKSINDRLLKNPLIEKTELAVQTYFNELMDIFNSKYKNEIITKGKDNNQSYLNKFMPDFSILKDDDTISFRFSYFVKIEYRIKLHTTN